MIIIGNRVVIIDRLVKWWGRAYKHILTRRYYLLIYYSRICDWGWSLHLRVAPRAHIWVRTIETSRSRRCLLVRVRIEVVALWWWRCELRLLMLMWLPTVSRHLWRRYLRWTRNIWWAKSSAPAVLLLLLSMIIKSILLRCSLLPWLLLSWLWWGHHCLRLLLEVLLSNGIGIVSDHAPTRWRIVDSTWGEKSVPIGFHETLIYCIIIICRACRLGLLRRRHDHSLW